ncbi:hypothetical protein EYC80_007729 [Monilinia laxa]|uniref:Uncharacterized protein n=1 Tax=Monilinia laxa TaxID=61186 RepID=A0A5N6JWT1_MONLA|nr:hypothetical protein EYC80_007729 [Monilinia laxa]
MMKDGGVTGWMSIISVVFPCFFVGTGGWDLFLGMGMQTNANANAHNKAWIYDCVIGASGQVRSDPSSYDDRWIRHG